MKKILILLTFSPLFLTAQTTFKVFIPEWVEVYEQIDPETVNFVGQGEGVYTFKLLKFTESVNLVVIADNKEYSLTLIASDRRTKVYYIWKRQDLVLNGFIQPNF